MKGPSGSGTLIAISQDFGALEYSDDSSRGRPIIALAGELCAAKSIHSFCFEGQEYLFGPKSLLPTAKVIEAVRHFYANWGFPSWLEWERTLF
jgi:hypothetical protein